MKGLHYILASFTFHDLIYSPWRKNQSLELPYLIMGTLKLIWMNRLNGKKIFQDLYLELWCFEVDCRSGTWIIEHSCLRLENSNKWVHLFCFGSWRIDFGKRKISRLTRELKLKKKKMQFWELQSGKCFI